MHHANRCRRTRARCSTEGEPGSEPNTRRLSEGRRRLLEEMRDVGYGRIEHVVVRDGEPVFDPPPRRLRVHLFGKENANVSIRFEGTMSSRRRSWSCSKSLTGNARSGSKNS